MSNGRTVGANTLHPSAIAQWDSEDQGILIPRMPTAYRTAIVSPADGLLVFDSTLHKLFEYQNGAWVQIGGVPNQLNTPFQSVNITGTENNFAGFANSTANRTNVSAFSQTITGILAESDGALKIIHNHSNYPLTLSHANGSSSAANRMWMGYDGLDIVLRLNDVAIFQYDGTTAQWRLVATTGERVTHHPYVGFKKTSDPGSDGLYSKLWANTNGRLHVTETDGNVHPVRIGNLSFENASEGGSVSWYAGPSEDTWHLNNTSLLTNYTINQQAYGSYPPTNLAIASFISRAGITNLTINFSPLVVTPGGTSASWTGTLAAGVAKKFQWIASTGAWWPIL